MRVLMKHGGTINKVNEEGSILHTAISFDSINIIQLILDEYKDFDYSILNNHQETVFHYCVAAEDDNTLKMLLEKVIEKVKEEDDSLCKILNIKNFLGNTLLHELVLRKKEHMLEFILNNNAYLNIDLKETDKEGLTYSDLQVN